jgi:hypothetical protein
MQVDKDPIAEMEQLVANGHNRDTGHVNMCIQTFFNFADTAKRERSNLSDRLNSIRKMLSGHPDYVEHSEFADQVSFIDDLIGTDDQEELSFYDEDANGFQICVNCGKPGPNCSDR